MRVTPGVKILVLSIVIAAAALRLFNLFHIPFTGDELTFLLTAKSVSFSDLIQNIVRNDSNPAGIQVVLFYMIKIVGLNEGWIKLPFILAGVASVYLIWKIGREWFSPTVGLLAASTIAFMQFPIIHSQMALPFASGLFFTLLMLLGWSRIVLMRTHNYRYNFILFVAGGILCSYNHYFTLLMVVLAVFSGFFFVKGKDLKKYIAGCLLILAAFIPHIPISLHQLKMAEAKQITFSCNADYLVGFAKYILNFSWIVACTLAAVVLFGLISSIVRKKLHFSKFHAVTLIFCVIPLLSAFLLSENFSLLHQYSVLLFSFPLLMVFAFSLYEKLSMRHTIGIMIVWSLILIHSLFWSRDHYRYFYHSQFEETTREIKAFTQTHPVDSTLVFCKYSSDIAGFYKNRTGISNDLKYVFTDSLQNGITLRKWLSDSTYNYLVIAGPSEKCPWVYALAHEYFPVSLQESYYNQGSCIVMKRGEAHYRNYLWGSLCDFSRSASVRWMFDPASVIKDTLNSSRVFETNSNVENGLSWTRHTSGFIRSQANIIDATIWVYLPEEFKGEARWSAALETDSGVISLNEGLISTDNLPVGQWAPLSVSVFLPGIRQIPFDSEIKVRLCTKNSSVFYVRQAFAGVRSGNPAIYWITYGLFD